MSHELAKAEIRLIIEIKKTQARELRGSSAGNNAEKAYNLIRSNNIFEQIEQLETAIKVLEDDSHV